MTSAEETTFLKLSIVQSLLDVMFLNLCDLSFLFSDVIF